MSKEDTPITAAAIAPRTTPPATIESKVFFREGVTAASATSGLEREAIIAVVAATESFCGALSLRLRVRIVGTKNVARPKKRPHRQK